MAKRLRSKLSTDEDVAEFIEKIEEDYHESNYYDYWAFTCAKTYAKNWMQGKLDATEGNFLVCFLQAYAILKSLTVEDPDDSGNDDDDNNNIFENGGEVA